MLRYIKGTTVAAFAALAGVSAVSAQAEAPRIAAALPGTITDRAFNENVHEGLVMAREQHGAEIAFTENVSQATQVEVMSDYARRGYDMVFGAGGEFTDAARRVAANFPEATVAVINGAPTEGVVTLNFRNQEFGYVVGLVAGHFSETGVAAALSAQRFAALDQVVDGFHAPRGARGGGFHVARGEQRVVGSQVLREGPLHAVGARFAPLPAKEIARKGVEVAGGGRDFRQHQSWATLVLMAAMQLLISSAGTAT